MITLAQVRASSVGNIAGVNVNNAQFTAYVNDAVRMLARSGDWWGTVQAMVGTVSQGGVVVWPEFVESVLAVNTNRRKYQLANYWFEFVPDEGRIARIANECGHGARHPTVRFSGTTPVIYLPSPANTFGIQATADNPADYGQPITIYGLDSNGNEVYTTQTTANQTSTVQRGATINILPSTSTANDNFGNPIQWSQITAVVKPITTAGIKLWVYNPPSAPFGNLVGYYSAQLTNPQYQFSHLTNTVYCDCKHIEALVKLKPLPALNDNDLIIFDNVDAIKQMVMAIRANESGDDDGITRGAKLELSAIRLLNNELRTKFPDQQVVMRVNSLSIHGNRIHNPN